MEVFILHVDDIWCS